MVGPPELLFSTKAPMVPTPPYSSCAVAESPAHQSLAVLRTFKVLAKKKLEPKCSEKKRKHKTILKHTQKDAVLKKYKKYHMSKKNKCPGQKKKQILDQNVPPVSLHHRALGRHKAPRQRHDVFKGAEVGLSFGAAASQIFREKAWKIDEKCWKQKYTSFMELSETVCEISMKQMKSL